VVGSLCGRTPKSEGLPQMKRIKLQIVVLALVPMLAVAGFAVLTISEKASERAAHAYLRPLITVA